MDGLDPVEGRVGSLELLAQTLDVTVNCAIVDRDFVDERVLRRIDRTVAAPQICCVKPRVTWGDLRVGESRIGSDQPAARKISSATKAA
jgi:hypothetical protein